MDLENKINTINARLSGHKINWNNTEFYLINPRDVNIDKSKKIKHSAKRYKFLECFIGNSDKNDVFVVRLELPEYACVRHIKYSMEAGMGIIDDLYNICLDSKYDVDYGVVNIAALMENFKLREIS